MVGQMASAAHARRVRRPSTTGIPIAFGVAVVLVITAACGGSDAKPSIASASPAAGSVTVTPVAPPESAARAGVSSPAPTLTRPAPVNRVTPRATAASRPAVETPAPIAPRAAADPQADFGDAPDGADAGYPQGSIVGRFPSLLASDGARIRNPGADVLGATVSAEPDALAENRDDSDDGVIALLVSLADPRPAAVLSLVVSLAADAPTGPRYVNALVDLNQDGTWGGATDGQSEWVVQDLRVDPVAGESMRVTTPPFGFVHAGVLPPAAWLRVVLTRAPMGATEWNGSGEFEFGEVEDYFIRRPDGPAPVVRCGHAIALDAHAFAPVACEVQNLGAAGDITFEFAAGGGIAVAPSAGTLTDVAGGETRRIDALAVRGWPAEPLTVEARPAVRLIGRVVDGEVVPLLLTGAAQVAIDTSDRPDIHGQVDAAADLAPFDSDAPAPAPDPTVDIVAWGIGRFDTTAQRLLGPEGYLACGAPYVLGTPAVICDSELLHPSGPYTVAWSCAEAPIPQFDSERVRTYWAIFEDGEIANDVVELGEFDNRRFGAPVDHLLG